jgi:hypothetical protein
VPCLSAGQLLPMDALLASYFLMAVGIAHDFNNVVTVMVAGVEVACEYSIGGELGVTSPVGAGTTVSIYLPHLGAA